jgi:hypothetical protein
MEPLVDYEAVTASTVTSPHLLIYDLGDNALDDDDDGRQTDVTLADTPRQPDLLLVDAPIIDAVRARKSSNEEVLCETPCNLERGENKSTPTSSNSPNPIDARGNTFPFSFRNGWANKGTDTSRRQESRGFSVSS